MTQSATFTGPSYISSALMSNVNQRWGQDYLRDRRFSPILPRFIEHVSHERSIVAPPVPARDFDVDLLSGYQQFFESMAGYAALPQDWNGEGSSPASRASCEAATAALVNFAYAGITPPSPMLFKSGVVGAFWRDGQKYISIDFDEDGEYPWCATDGEQYWSGMWLAGSSIPRELLEFLPKV